MRFKIFSGLSAVIIVVCLAVSCAKVSAPTGGPREYNPPVVVKSIPVAGATNFRGKRIEITFDEYVALDNINEKFMVSPPMKKKPMPYLRGKSLFIDFEEGLKDNTTYTFYFQDAIRDLNEANILDNYQFVFSTGPVLDSLSVTGNVYNSLSLEVPEKALVMMFRNLTDSVVRKYLPDYISAIDQNGYFRISNVKAGTYRLYALVDDDNSKNYNLPDESFAFLDSLLSVSPEKNYIHPVKDTVTVKAEKKGPVKKAELPVLTGEYQLLLFTGERREHYLSSSSRELKYKLIYTLSLPPDTMKLSFSIPDAVPGSFYIENSRNRDTMKVWITDSTLYSSPQITTMLRFPFTDSLGITGYKLDTIPLRFAAPRATRAARVKRPVFAYESNLRSGDLKPGEGIWFNSATPFNTPDTSRIRFYELVDSKKVKLPYSFQKEPLNSCRYYLKANLMQGKKYLFIADSASFSNIYNEYSDSVGIRFSVRDPESYNKLSLDVSNYQGSRIVQLLTKDEKPVGQLKAEKDSKLTFNLLEPGSYRARIIYDLNGDGKWTTGDFSKKRQPEPVSYYYQEIELKTGWNADNLWDVKIKNSKDQKLRTKKEGSR
jgi:hypothetical protein